MLRPDELDGVLAATRARAKRRSVTQHADAPLAERSVPLPVRGRGVAAPAPSQARTTHSLQSISGTGINPWWRYQEEDIPGGGHVMVNVGTGNVLIQDDDMAVPHKGVALTFRRTYNSQAPAVEPGDFIPWQNLYGTGWTNTFNAHMRVSNALNHKIVYDIDGARYDYGPDGSGGWVSVTPGQHATLVYDGACGYAWTKKSGTTYYFYKTNPSASGCPGFATMGGYSGRLYRIIGRNRNTYLTFSYSWDNGDASVTGKISAISVQTESGMTANLAFADVSGHRLLQSTTFPDGATSVFYGYDTQGNLNNVSRPPNNAFSDRPSHGYGYVTQGSGGSIIGWADSPRWAKGGGDGNVTSFAFTGSSPETATLNAMSRYANVNPAIPDGTNSGPLQSGHPTAAYEYYDEFYSTGVSQPTFRDSDGHATNWVVDSQGRPTQTQECTATTSGTCTWLVSNETWDTDNNLAVAVDPRGNETDYLYDLVGNTTAVGEPYTTTSEGSFKPTKLFDYDAFNNVVAYCDESETHAMQGDWTPATTSIWPHDDLCATHPNVVPHRSATYSYPSYEPYGELTSMTTPLGYTRTLAYAPAQQAGNDFGLPTSVTGASFTQVDGTTIAPAQTFWYDANGYLRCYRKSQGTGVFSYDALGRMTSLADSDDSSANASSVCGKASGQPGWNTQMTHTYFPDGALKSSQSPVERATGLATAFTYDVDGNMTSETHHYGCTSASSCTAGVTNKWYDGAGRLVEVGLPHDPLDYYSSPWLTRHLYDLSAGGSVSIGGTSYRAYGNLYKSQEWVPAPGASSPSWLDLRGTAYDALDRTVTKYTFSPSSNTTLRATNLAHDASAATLGLLSSSTDPLGEITTLAYDPLGHTTAVQFSGDGGVTPKKTFAYDANGRQTSAYGAVYGTQTIRYDADGNVAEVDEPTTGSMTSPARISYDYYPDGEQKDVNVISGALNASPLISYDYRADGKRARLHVGFGQRQGDFTWTYTDGGRPLTQSDPYTGTVMPSPQAPVATGTLYAPLTMTYDANGDLAQHALPETLAYGLHHDVEGHVASFLASNSMSGPFTMNYVLTVRGENIGSAVAPSAPQYPSHVANGAVVSPKSIPLQKGFQTPVVDPVNAVVLSTSYEWIQQYNDANVDPPSGFVDCGRMTTMQDYDVAGRLLGHTVSGTGSGDARCSNAGPPFSTISDYYSYDAENHHIGDRGGSWSPNGRVYNLGGTSIHYDGAVPLFGTDAQGRVWVKIESLADIDPTGKLAVWDRDYTGLLQTGHNDVVYYNINVGNVVAQPGTPSIQFRGSSNAAACGTSGSTCLSGAEFLPYKRLEGFDYMDLTFQGARAVESASGQWTTPDAYAGNTHDPMSQKPFMWDRNDPYEYSDPSGYFVMMDPGGRMGWRRPWCPDCNTTTGSETKEKSVWERFKDWLFHKTPEKQEILQVFLSPAAVNDAGPRIDAANNAMAKQLDDVTVNAAVTEAQLGAPMNVNNSPMSHVSDVQGGINSLNRTLLHLEKMAQKYSNDRQDVAELKKLSNNYTQKISEVRKQFRDGGVENAIRW